MSVSTEIQRIQTARNTIRAKEVALGIGLSTDNLTQLATKFDGMVNQGAVDAEVKEGETYTVPAGYHNGSGVVKGVAGGGNYNLQAKTTTPTKQQQSIAPDSGYYGLSTVTVGAIPDAYQDVTDVTAVAADVLSTKVFVTSTGAVVAGTMANNGAVSQKLDTETTSYTVPSGYHSGSGTVSITTEAKTATPTTSSQTIEPSSGKVLSSVTVNKIPDNFGDATDKTGTAADVLLGKTVIGWNDTDNKAVSLTGTMANNGAVTKSLDCGASYTIPAGYHNGSGKVTANSLASQTGVDTGKTAIAAATVLSGSQGWVNGSKISGTMANNGAVTQSLNCGESYTIPAGYHDGEGTVTANSLSSQTGVETGKTAITAATVLTGSQGWVNGSRISGTMVNNGAVSKKLDTETTSYTVPAGYHSGSGTVSITLETKAATPTEESQTIEPTSGKVLSSVTVNKIPAKYGNATDKTVTASDILAGKTAIGWNDDDEEAVSITGTMTNNGAVTQSLNCGASYTIPAGYHNGSGKVTANSLASQTGVDTGKTAIAAATVLSGSQGWVNGSKISGTMANNGAVTATITGLGSVTGDTYYIIPAGYHNGSGTVSIASNIENQLADI